ncbi:MAG: hypothetical protein KDA84_24915 [Planctomycetaceae bacterium]|nr:hypothetical protein [Planctomycetaceae bacterium]
MSIRFVICGLTVVVMGFGWAFLAASYAHTHENWQSGVGKRGSLAAFFSNAFEQIPNFFAVIGFHLTNRLWLLLIFVGLQGLVLLLGLGMKKMEQADAKPRRRNY